MVRRPSPWCAFRYTSPYQSQDLDNWIFSRFIHFLAPECCQVPETGLLGLKLRQAPNTGIVANQAEQRPSPGFIGTGRAAEMQRSAKAELSRNFRPCRT